MKIRYLAITVPGGREAEMRFHMVPNIADGGENQ